MVTLFDHRERQGRRVLQELLPFERHYAEVAGFRMHYIDEGGSVDRPERPVVLLLHGNPTWCFYYRALIAELRISHRVIAPDYIGCGLSDHPAREHFRATDRVAHIAELISYLGINRFSLVMHDWGGPIGTSLAVSMPERIDRLVYLNTTLSEVESLPGIIKTAASPVVGKIITKHTMRFLKLMTTFGVAKRLARDVRQGYYFPYRTSSRRTAIWDFVADIPFNAEHPTYSAMLSMAQQIPALRDVPVKIVWGLRDPCFHREMLSKVAQHFPQADVLEIAEASHLVLEDAPEVAVPAIVDFLRLGAVGDIVDGGPQSSDSAGDFGSNPLVKGFFLAATTQAQNDAVIEPRFWGDSVRYLHTNFESMRRLVYKYQRGLIDLGLCPGDRVLMLVPPGCDFLALTYAVMAAGAVPVFLDPGMGFENLCRCIEDCRPDALICAPKAHLLRLIRHRLFRGLKFHLTASDWFLSGGPNLSYLKKFSSAPLNAQESSGIALIAFTSGATGTPKGVLFTDQMVERQLAIFSEVFGLAPGHKDCPLLPVFSLFTLGLGICSVFPPIDTAKPLELDPARFGQIVNDLGVDYSFGSPTLWGKIAEYSVRNNIILSSLKKIFMAGAPVPLHTLEMLARLAPNGESATPYGATEALPVTLASSREILDHVPVPAFGGEQGVFVGRAIPGIELRIIRTASGPIVSISQAEILPPREIGEIIVKGANVSPRYLNRPDANQNGKIADGVGVWHRMGDVGYLDEAGNIYLCGRKQHIVVVEGQSLYPLPVEHIFNEHRFVRRSALVSLGGQAAAVVIEPVPEAPVDELLRDDMLALARSNPLTQSIEEVFFHRSFPVDARHNAKIFRDKLGDWATEECRRRQGSHFIKRT